MFLVDKYKPKTINEVYFNNEEFEKLKIISQDDSIPHMIFYGPEGCGKQTAIDIFLEQLYGPSVHNIKYSNYVVTCSGNTKKDVRIKQSNFHIVIEPNNNNSDRYLIQDVIKEYAKKIPFSAFTNQKKFKIVVINTIDDLPYYAQTSLRRMLETYSGTCRFIMKSRSLSKVIDPLLSRCYCFRLSSANDKELFKLLTEISAQEKIKTTLDQYEEILKRSKGNAQKAVWLLELNKHNCDFDINYDIAINEIVSKIKKPSIDHIKTIRNINYDLIVTNINGTNIITDILDKLIEDETITDECKFEIVNQAALAEHCLIQGRREAKHIERFIVNVMYCIIESKK
jgi:replication factor C subunit 3/5